MEAVCGFYPWSKTFRRKETRPSTQTLKVTPSTGRLADKSSKSNSQLGGDREKLEDVTKLKSTCDQNSPSSSPKQNEDQDKLAATDFGNIFQNITDDSILPPFYKDVPIPSKNPDSTPHKQQLLIIGSTSDNANTTSLGWLKKVVEKKRKSIPFVVVEVDTITKILHGSAKPKKARKMSRIINDEVSRHQLLEVADPIGDLNENKITTNDYKITHVDMGLATFEGDVYHAGFSMDALIKCTKALRKENIKLQSQVLTLSQFISSLIATLVVEESTSSHIESIDSKMLQQVKRSMVYSKGANEWMKMISQNALGYLSEIVPFYSKVSSKRKELLTKLQHMRKEKNTLFVLPKEVTDLVNLDPIIWIGEKIVNDPKEVDPNRADYLEWRLDIYDNLIKETNTAM